MGDCFSTPDVTITPDQIEAIKELIYNAEHFKNMYVVIPFLLPIKYEEEKKDLERAYQSFMDDERQLSSIKGHPDALAGTAESVNSTVEKLCEAVNPLAESTLGEKLKEQIDPSVPQQMKDKAVSIAVEKAVQAAVEELIKMLCEKQIKGEFPKPGGYNKEQPQVPSGNNAYAAPNQQGEQPNHVVSVNVTA